MTTNYKSRRASNPLNCQAIPSLHTVSAAASLRCASEQWRDDGVHHGSGEEGLIRVPRSLRWRNSRKRKSSGPQKKINKEKEKPTIKIMQWNAEGVTPKTDALGYFLKENSIDVCCIQETHLQKDKTFKIRGYQQPFRNDREGRKKGGVVTLVKNNLNAIETKRLTGEAEYLQIKLSTKNGSMDIGNYYCPDDKLLSLDSIEVPVDNFIIAGDFNSHSQSWGYTNMNKRGENVEEWQDENHLILANDPMDQHTFYSRRWHSSTTPDLAFCTEDLHQRLTRKVCSQLAGSDHRPVLLTISGHQPENQPKHPRWNYKKAKWSLFRNRTNELTKDIQVEGRNPNIVIRDWNSEILKAAKETIPRGVRENYKPYYTTKLNEAHENLTTAREKAEKNPCTENNKKLQECQDEYLRASRESKQRSWREKTESLSMEKETKLWNLIKALNDEAGGQSTITLDQEGKIATGKTAANIFAKAFEDVSNVQVPREREREVREEEKQRISMDTTEMDTFDVMQGPITMAELEKAIKKLNKKKSPGPDGITNEMIMHLGDTALQKLLDIFNLSWKNGDVPQIWKDATMIPILKKGKNKSKALSYRPISLTSCVCKTMERIINQRMQWHLESQKTIVPEQAGFRQYRSTEDQTTHLSQVIEDAFQAKKVVLAAFIDLKKAFDKVWKSGLMVKLLRAGIRGNMLRWTKSYLHSRKARVLVNGHFGRKVLLRQGVPQGGVLSPTLFILFINDIVAELPKGVNAALYADDLVLYCTEEHATTARYRMQIALDKLTAWSKRWCVAINMDKDKTSATLFTLTAQKAGTLTLGDQQLGYKDEQTHLGITFDKRLTWKKQIENAESKARRKLGIMRKLAGTEWGANERILNQVYKGTVRPHLEYGSSAYMTAAQTHRDTLEKVQNQALRIITGAVRSTPIEKMQQITGIPPLKQRRNSKALIQFIKAKAMKEHPMHDRTENLGPSRLHRSNFIRESKTLQRSIQEQIPTKVENIKPTGDPPNREEQPKNITICTTVPQLGAKDETSKEIQKSLTLEMIGERYPQEAWTHIYTDGSATNAIRNGGAGVFIQNPDERIAIAQPTGVYCSNYKAEVEALTIAANTVKNPTDTRKQIVFFTDALSVLKTLDGGGLPSLQAALQSIKCHALVLQWIPAHCGVKGNEEADRLAKLGAEKEQPETSLASYAEMKTIIKSLHKPPRHQESYHKLARHEQVIIFRLRTGHNRLNKHMHTRFKLVQTPKCPCGEADQTTEHVLQHCTNHDDLRKQTWTQETSLQDKLYGPVEALKKTTRFIAETGLKI